MAAKREFKQFHIGFSEEEWNAVCKKAAAAHLRKGTYVRTIAVHGEIKIYDMSEVVHLMRSFNAIGTNLNQIAKVANSTGSVYQKDIDDMKEQFEYFHDVMNDYLRELKPKEIL